MSVFSHVSFPYFPVYQQKATEKCKADAASIYPENGDGNYELHKSYDQEEQKK